MTTLKFFCIWHGEKNAGILPGSEDVTITFDNTDSLDGDTVEFFRDTLVDYYDGATVLTETEREAWAKNYYNSTENEQGE